MRSNESASHEIHRLLSRTPVEVPTCLQEGKQELYLLSDLRPLRMIFGWTQHTAEIITAMFRKTAAVSALTRLFVSFLLATTTSTVHAFCVHRSHFVGCQLLQKKQYLTSEGMTMTDGSASYWFKVGDSVRVTTDVYKGSDNLKDRIGLVNETWEKCDVDPTCCCAEQVDKAMAVRVEFEDNTTDAGKFFHYFAEEELVAVGNNPMYDSTPGGQAFDGMSCKAFKLEALQVDQKKRGIASFTPTSTKNGENQ